MLPQYPMHDCSSAAAATATSPRAHRALPAGSPRAVSSFHRFTGPAHTVDEDSAHALGGTVPGKEARMMEDVCAEAHRSPSKDVGDVEGGWIGK